LNCEFTVASISVASGPAGGLPRALVEKICVGFQLGGLRAFRAR
jgi:hypothetical protein